MEEKKRSQGEYLLVRSDGDCSTIPRLATLRVRRRNMLEAEEEDEEREQEQEGYEDEESTSERAQEIVQANLFLCKNCTFECKILIVFVRSQPVPSGRDAIINYFSFSNAAILASKSSFAGGTLFSYLPCHPAAILNSPASRRGVPRAHHAFLAARRGPLSSVLLAPIVSARYRGHLINLCMLPIAHLAPSPQLARRHEDCC